MAIPAAAFFDLLPESAGSIGLMNTAYFSLAGLLSFFALEKCVHWHHHNKGMDCPSGDCGNKGIPPLGWMILLGDGLHNFFDGVAIAAAFIAGIPVGISVTIAVALHEIPHEIGDFSILLYGGLDAAKAAFYNLLSALTATAGALLFYFASSSVSNLSGYGLAFAFGNFLYIAVAGLVPELRKEKDAGRSAIQLATISLGILSILLAERVLG